MRRTFPPLLKLVVILLLFVLPSCGIYEAISVLTNMQKKKQKQSTYRQIKHNSAGEALVTLKPPYTEWAWDKQSGGKISVQNAVWAATQQAGMGYNQKKSYANTTPLCRNWAHPDFENKPWKEAVKEILAPVNLTYAVESNQVVLMKVEDASSREQAIQQLQAGIAQFLSDPHPRKLPDAVLIFPLLDANGRTTQLGTLLSELGMLKATYLPEKALNLHLPSVIGLYYDMGFDSEGETVTDKEQDRLRRRFEAKEVASGTVEFNDVGAFRLVLNFDGQYGKRKFSASGTKDDLYRTPQWIAKCVHEYCHTNLSPRQQEYLNLPELRDPPSLYTLAELEHNYLSGRRDLARWSRLQRFNPDSVFILYRYCLASKDQGRDDSADRIMAAMRVLGDNRLLKFVEADRYHQVENYRDSAPLFFELLTGDFRNEALYDRLDDGLLALGLGEKAEALHVFWEGACPDSYLASWSMGSFYISYAWDARGSGWGSTVTEEGWKKFNERLRLAEQHFIHACELDPQDPRAPASLITIARGLGYDSGYMEKWFKQAVEADPKYYGAYKNKLTYLMPKWQGTREEMFAFARECAANPPKGSRVALILMDAHKEMAYRWADSTGKKWREYYQEPGVWEELKPVYERYFQEHPDSISDRNHCAKIAFWAHDYKEAVRQFEVIGKDIDKECWGSEQYFYKCRTDAYAKANGEHRG